MPANIIKGKQQGPLCQPISSRGNSKDHYANQYHQGEIARTIMPANIIKGKQQGPLCQPISSRENSKVTYIMPANIIKGK